MTIFLILSLSSCLTTVETRYVLKRPPLELTDERSIPAFQGSTVNDLQMYTFDLIELNKLSNTDKRKLREWYDAIEQELNGNEG